LRRGEFQLVQIIEQPGDFALVQIPKRRHLAATVPDGNAERIQRQALSDCR
jgi:hypothetical protein